MLVAIAGSALLAGQSAHEGLGQVNLAMQAGEAEKALALLQALPQPAAASAEAHNLHCRVLFILEQFESANRECERSVALDDKNSNYHLWYGRTLGEVADRANFVSAYSLAKRARAEFEQAVELNPRSAEALADLGEFYSSAPGVVGGGADKAAKVALQLDSVDPARAHELRAAIAPDDKDLNAAKREFSQAIAARPSAFSGCAWPASTAKSNVTTIWKALFRADTPLLSGIRTAGVALFNGASVLTKANRNPGLPSNCWKRTCRSRCNGRSGPHLPRHVWLARPRH
jgi:tetratricopeptide (TPR) repeat protein